MLIEFTFTARYNNVSRYNDVAHFHSVGTRYIYGVQQT